ncbi:hypothetical protein GTW66_05845 [Streptomyces sp. SID5473]|nr:hypothetical protein [Streptomyces sp. SID5473]TAI45885.1 hypothetical protein EWI31_01750 [Streptomyces tsukubensis]
MPSLTVWVSSDTDICFITPGMGSPHRGRARYGDCLPTLQPARPRIHSGPVVTRRYLSFPFMLAHRPGGDGRAAGSGPAGGGVRSGGASH